LVAYRGLQVDSVAIGIAGDDAAGHTNVIGSDEHLSEFDRIVISEAGLEAQEVFEAPTHDHAGLADYAKIIDLLRDRKLTGFPGEASDNLIAWRTAGPCISVTFYR
jgi:hypothetical protein